MLVQPGLTRPLSQKVWCCLLTDPGTAEPLRTRAKLSALPLLPRASSDGPVGKPPFNQVSSNYDIWLISGAMKQEQNEELGWGGAAMELGWPGKASQRWWLLSRDVNEQKRQQVKMWGKIPGRRNLRWVGWIWRTERSQCGRAWWTLGWMSRGQGDQRWPEAAWSRGL